MAAKSKTPFDYIAHIQQGGKVTEMAGTREDYSMKHVYQWLWQIAQDMGGWLLTETITEAAKPDESAGTPEVVHTSQEVSEPSVEEDHPEMGDLLYWGVYQGKTYSGASRLTFKEDNPDGQES